jgi:hypothetical protein
MKSDPIQEGPAPEARCHHLEDNYWSGSIVLHAEMAAPPDCKSGKSRMYLHMHGKPHKTGRSTSLMFFAKEISLNTEPGVVYQSSLWTETQTH